MTLKIVSWNIAHRTDPWRRLVETGADIAILQEAGAPPPEVAARIQTSTEPWRTAGGVRRWRAAVVRLSDRVQMDWIPALPLPEAYDGGLPVSIPGTLEAARVTPPDGEPFIVASLYAEWTEPDGRGWIMSDPGAHRAISDLSYLIGHPERHRILAAGDFNSLRGYGDDGSAYWAGRYGTVFDRIAALGLVCVGPQAPNGRQADPWPDELPADSQNVPTYHTLRQTPATATRQLDFVFASRGFAESVGARAMNTPDEWGPSDHCQVEITIT